MIRKQEKSSIKSYFFHIKLALSKYLNVNKEVISI